MRILFAGTPEPALPALRALLASRHEVVAALTRPDAPAGRGGRLVASPVALAAQDAGLPVLKPSSLRAPDFLDQVRDLGIDVAVIVAYGALIRPPLLDLPAHGWVNLHFSLLPAWRGAAPGAGRDPGRRPGRRCHHVPAGGGAGHRAGVRGGHRADRSARYRRSAAASDSPNRAPRCWWRRWTASRTARSQARAATRGGRQPRPEGDPGRRRGGLDAARVGDRPVDQVGHPRSRCVDRESVGPSGPGAAGAAWSTLEPGSLEPRPAGDGVGLRPGELAVGKREVLVGTGSGAVRLGAVRPPGRRPMPAADWARGARPEPGAVLGPVSRDSRVPQGAGHADSDGDPR